jgi:hypothetical protein
VQSHIEITGRVLQKSRKTHSMPITERIELDDGAIRLAAQVSLPNTPEDRPAVIVAPGGVEQGVIPAYDWIASRLVEAGYVTLTITYRAKSLSMIRRMRASDLIGWHVNRTSRPSVSASSGIPAVV